MAYQKKKKLNPELEPVIPVIPAKEQGLSSIGSASPKKKLPEPSDESDFDFTEEEVSETVCFIADGICGLFKLTGLSPIQKKTFGKRCYQVAKKRLPEYAKDNADVVGLALVTASIIGHKLIEKRSKQDNRNLREKGEGKDLPLQKVDAGDGEAVAV